MVVGKKRNGGRVNDSCKRWRNERGSVTAEELESLLNLVCILLREDGIGFRFTYHSFFCGAHVGYGIGWSFFFFFQFACQQVYIYVSFSIRMQMRQEHVVMEGFRACVSYSCCIRML